MVSDWLLSESSADSFVCLFARESRLLHRAVFRGRSGGDVATLDKEIPGLVTVGDEVNLVWNAKRRLGPMTVGSTEHEEQLLSMVSLKKLLKESNARCLAEESMRRLFLHHFLLRDSPRDLVVSSGETFKRFEIGMHSSLGSSNVRA